MDLSAIIPFVLCGGFSRRFGRDKLREPFGDGWLIDRPIAALRGVFGPRVMLVGQVDEILAARADGVLADLHPGAGPAGGILSALESTPDAGGVCVLAGDLPAITPAALLLVLAEADAHPEAWAVWAVTDRPQPCIGLYRAGAITPLRQALLGDRSLHRAISSTKLRAVRINPSDAFNINTLEDAASHRASAANNPP